MEEIVTGEDDVEPQFAFITHTRTTQYRISVMKNRIEIASINSLDQIQVVLSIDQTIHWLYDEGQEIAFGFRQGYFINYYYGERSELSQFRKLIGCKISFGTFKQDYLVGDLLGKGTFSEVTKVTCLRDGKEYALKKIKLRNEAHLKNIEIEVAILNKLNHQGIIKLHDVYRLNDETYGLITELVIGQSLDSIINKQKSKLEERDIQMILKQTLEIVDYLHQNNIIHRDIKPQHMILCQNKTIKILDFGLSSNESQMSCNCGTPGYLPPESFREQSLYTSKGDIFSLGVVFYKLLNRGVSCFDANTLESVMSKNRRCTIEYQINGYSSQALHLLKQMLQKDPVMRINSHDALNHTYFTVPRESQNLKEDKGNIYVYQAHPRPSHLSRTSSGELEKTSK
ncbi:unnamed protein product (macronuclear) [Paramecium tetraurelia]|uniref:Protein kinase domain-containing protein n=1 Tax=Paramecium tetraurelia TaxID=5888 RepID=A0BYJ9_PARTE|nr:uncharacterized protein GSPATT00033469001 [Paramecium tetraurelia]CAK63616.1 unnamed protein product [Paramecium tetraurelia]|eukprot:XP_001431014.1 hypothetical protein (macronuclear) [Paramecium tetraurelia strain d4-2]